MALLSYVNIVVNGWYTWQVSHVVTWYNTGHD